MFFKVCNTLSSKECFFRDERLEEALFLKKQKLSFPVRAQGGITP